MSDTTDHWTSMKNVQLNKYIADSGVCSRRKAAELIKDGKVKVNGEIVKESGRRIDEQRHSVEIQGKGVINHSSKEKKSLYIMLNKPRGFVCTTRKFKGEKNVLDLIKAKERIFPVGRLDKDSEGLLILTNDGEFANRMIHPRYEHEKEYEVLVDKEIKENEMEKLKNGIKDDGEELRVKQAKRIAKNKLKIILTEGKKRHIRRMLRMLGYETVHLRRVRMGDIKLGGLKVGKWKHITKPNF